MGKPAEAWLEEMKVLDEKVKQCVPKDNVFDLTAKGWEKREWGEGEYAGHIRLSHMPWIPTVKGSN